MKYRCDITFLDIRNMLIKANPIVNVYPKIRHGFITANACEKHGWAVMYYAVDSSTFNIDFMYIENMYRGGIGYILQTMLRPEQSNGFFDLNGFIRETGDKIEASCVVSLDTALMDMYYRDDKKLYGKWRSFVLDLYNELDK